MSHPFPLSSFRVDSVDDIERIRGLGLRQLRWSHDKSAPHEGDGAAGAERAGPAAVQAEAPAPARPARAKAAVTPQERRRALLEAQRGAARRCEEQFDEATAALKLAVADVRDKPDAAREASQALARALHEKMLGDEQLCVCVLSAQAGEKPMAHSLNVAVISMLMARLFRFEQQDMLELGTGALLHDIGKLELPHRVHTRQERLSPAEAQAYRDHVRLGVTLGQRMNLPATTLQVIEQHHEHADGSGFPQGLGMDRMSDAARIVSLVNRYDDLCNPRNPGRAMTPHEALSRLFAQGKGKFDATMLNAFIRMMGVYPAGSVVQLTDDRFAIVTHVNASRPLKPQVLVHDPAVPRDEALTLNLLGEPDLGIRRSLPAAQLPDGIREYLQPVQRLAYFFEPVASPGELEPAWL